MAGRRSGRWFVLPGVLAALLAGCEVRAGADTEEGLAADLEPSTPVHAAGSIPPGLTEEEVERGRELFLPCAVCHGLDGQGNQLGPSLRDTVWVHIDGSLASIEQIIRSGVPQPLDYPVPMVPMGGGEFDDADLRAVAAYVYAISHPSPPDSVPPAERSPPRRR
ncbi:MAG TPA: c-type cytochrome [Longimicrobiaceae bacterium]